MSPQMGKYGGKFELENEKLKQNGADKIR